MINKKFFVLAILFGLWGCVVTVPNGKEGIKAPVIGVTTTHSTTPYSLVGNHWSDVAKIKSEAERLSLRIGSGEITKKEAADQLNHYRLNLVGSNLVDDSVFQTYLNATIDSSAGKITNEQSKNLIKSALIGWGNRWKSMNDNEKPKNPAFTNFLNETMGLPYLK